MAAYQLIPGSDTPNEDGYDLEDDHGYAGSVYPRIDETWRYETDLGSEGTGYPTAEAAAKACWQHRLRDARNARATVAKWLLETA